MSVLATFLLLCICWKISKNNQYLELEQCELSDFQVCQRHHARFLRRKRGKIKVFRTLDVGWVDDKVVTAALYF